MAKSGKSKTKEIIIEKASALFAEQGYEGTTTRQLASAAGVALHTLNYHFGGKRGIYYAVLMWAMEPFREIVSNILEEKLYQDSDDIISPKEIVANIVDDLFNELQKNPDNSKLFYRAWVDSDPNLGAMRDDFISSIVKEWMRIIGAFDEGDPDLYLSIVSIAWMILGFATQPEFSGKLLNQDHCSDEYFKRIKKHITENIVLLIGRNNF